MKLIADFNSTNKFEELKAIFDKMLDDIFGNSNSTKIAVKINNVTDGGIIESEEIYVFDTYTNALDAINANEYKLDVSVEVFEISKEGYTHMLYKVYDGHNYSHLALPTFQKYELFTVRRLFDNSAKVYEGWDEAMMLDHKFYVQLIINGNDDKVLAFDSMNACCDTLEYDYNLEDVEDGKNHFSGITEKGFVDAYIYTVDEWRNIMY